MEFEYRGISEERCKEINNWRIRDPYGYGKFFMAESTRFVTNKDESILFCRSFRPRHDDVGLGITQSTYLLVVNKSYYAIDYHVDNIIAHDDKHWHFIVSIMERDFIDENRNELLNMLKNVISIFLKKHRRERPGEEFEYQFFYKGEEI